MSDSRILFLMAGTGLTESQTPSDEPQEITDGEFSSSIENLSRGEDGKSFFFESRIDLNPESLQFLNVSDIDAWQQESIQVTKTSNDESQQQNEYLFSSRLNREDSIRFLNFRYLIKVKSIPDIDKINIAMYLNQNTQLTLAPLQSSGDRVFIAEETSNLNSKIESLTLSNQQALLPFKGNYFKIKDTKNSEIFYFNTYHIKKIRSSAKI